MTVGKLVVALIAQTKPFTRGLARAHKSLKSFGMSVLRIGAIAAAAFIGLGLALRPFIRAASEAEEVANKFRAVFKHMADDAQRWAEQYARSTGFARTATMRWMATLQDTFVPLGYTREAAAGMSKQLVALVGDLASFNNVAPDQVLMDIQSAIVGNHETMRKYGVIITETTLKQYALAQGIWDGTGQLTNQQKVMARLGIIIQGTTDAQGDLERTQDSYANTVRRLMGAWQNLKEAIGAPIKDILTPIFSKAAEWIAKLGDKSKQIYAFIVTLFHELRIAAVNFGTIFVNNLAWIGKTAGNVADRIRQAFTAALAFLAKKLSWFIDIQVDAVNLLIRALNKIPKVDIAELKLSGKDFAAGFQAAAASYEKDITERNKRYYAGVHEREAKFQAFAAGLRENYAEMINKQWETLEQKAEETKALIEETAAVASGGALKRPAALQRGRAGYGTAAYATPHYRGLEKTMRDSLALDKERNETLNTLPADVGRAVAENLAVATL